MNVKKIKKICISFCNVILSSLSKFKHALMVCTSRERDRMERRQPVRSRSQERRRRRSREREDMFKGSLSEGMKAEQEDSDEEV